MEPATEERKKWHWLDRPKGPHKVPPHPRGGGGDLIKKQTPGGVGWTSTHPEILPDPPPVGVGWTLSKTLIIYHAKHCTCSPLEDAFEDAFARGLGAGFGSGNFKFLGMKLPCMWSLVKYNLPSKTWAIPHKPRAALAQITSLGLSSESPESSLEEERSEMGLSSSVSVPESESVTKPMCYAAALHLYRIKIRYQINAVPTPTVAWTRA